MVVFEDLIGYEALSVLLEDTVAFSKEPKDGNRLHNHPLAQNKDTGQVPYRRRVSVSLLFVNPD